MRTIIWAAVAVFSGLGPVDAGPVGQPSAADYDLMRDALTGQLLDPASVIIEDVVAIDDPADEGAVTICGQIRGKTGLGGYGQPAMFMVMIDAPMEVLGGGRSVQVAKIADTDDRQQLLSTICVQQAAAANAAETASEQLRQDLRDFSGAVLACEVLADDCTEHDEIAARMTAAGWCQGGVSRWVPCDSR